METLTHKSGDILSMLYALELRAHRDGMSHPDTRQLAHECRRTIETYAKQTGHIPTNGSYPIRSGLLDDILSIDRCPIDHCLLCGYLVTYFGPQYGIGASMPLCGPCYSAEKTARNTVRS